jgi:hypothetical protein
MDERPEEPEFPPPPVTPGLRSERPTRRPIAVDPALRQAGFSVVIGGLLVVVGVFLPWVTASGPLGNASENGLAIGTWGTLILGGFAVIRGLSMLRPATIRALGSPLIGGVLLAVLMALRWSDLQQVITATEAQSPAITASLGIGVWCTIAGTALILAGSALVMLRRRR